MTWIRSVFATLFLIPLTFCTSSIRTLLVKIKVNARPPLLALASLAIAVIFVPSVALAGPLADLVEAVSPGSTNVAWWAELVAALTAVCSLLVAALPQGVPGGVWDRVRSLLNFFAVNFLNAKNEGN